LRDECLETSVDANQDPEDARCRCPAPLLYLADVAPDAPPGMTLMAEARHFFA
jgi:hypothetical protein